MQMPYAKTSTAVQLISVDLKDLLRLMKRATPARAAATRLQTLSGSLIYSSPTDAADCHPALAVPTAT